MTTLNRMSSLAVAVAAFAMACADPAGLDRTLVPESGPTLDVNVNPSDVNTLLPGDINFPGRVRVCKQTPLGDPSQTWTFSIQVATEIGGPPPAAVTWDGSIDGVAGQTVCETAFVSAKSGDGLDEVIITEQALPANWTLDHIHIDRFVHGAGPYTPPAGTPLDAGVLATRVATLYINGDMLRDVTFGNNFTEEEGCTLTQGYWKNHLLVWPAPYDPSDPFFNSGKTAQQVITIEEDGNAYYILGRQFIAALLNVANGASTTPAVDQALTDAAALFAGWPAGTTGPTNAQGRANWITLAGILDQFNRGLIGPGKCTG